ncbi:serine/threonine-protein kinase [Planctomycetota bacterium]
MTSENLDGFDRLHPAFRDAPDNLAKGHHGGGGLPPELVEGSPFELPLRVRTGPDLKPASRRGPELTGRVIGGCHLESVVATARAATVYSGTDAESGEERAVKILRADPRILCREPHLFQAIEQLRHDNVVTVHRAGCDGELAFVVMDLLTGGTLASKLETHERGLPLLEGLRAMREVVAGLVAAHAHGVIHADLKPGNVLFDSAGVARVVDFGLACAVVDRGRLRGGMVHGIPAYVSPEDCSGEELTTASDLYSLGATFYHAFVGRPPFVAAKVTAVLLKHTYEEPSPPIEVRSDLPPALSNLLLQLLEKDPARRSESAEAVLRAIDAILRDM